MPADRRVDTAGGRGQFPHQGAVGLVAHPVQALEFVSFDPARRLDDGCDGQGIVRRELRIEVGAGRQQALGAVDIVEVRNRLPGEDRVVVEPALLGALHLRVPIGTLDEAHHETPVERLG